MPRIRINVAGYRFRLDGPKPLSLAALDERDGDLGEQGAELGWLADNVDVALAPSRDPGLVALRRQGSTLRGSMAAPCTLPGPRSTLGSSTFWATWCESCRDELRSAPSRVPSASACSSSRSLPCGGRALEADSFQTSACFWLSVVGLVGITLNAVLGWWWADPAAAFGIALLLVKEGREGLRGESCCDGCE